MSNVTLANGASGAALVAGSGSNLFISEDMVEMLRKGLSELGKGEVHVIASFDLLAGAGWFWSDLVPNGKKFEGVSTQTDAKRERLQAWWLAAQTRAVQTLLALPAAAAQGQVAAGWDKSAYTAAGKPKDRRFWQAAMGDEVTGLGVKWRNHLQAQENKANYLKHQELIAAGDLEGALAIAALLPNSTPKTHLTPSEYLDQELSKVLGKIEKASKDSVDLPALRDAVMLFRGQIRKMAKAAE